MEFTRYKVLKEAGHASVEKAGEHFKLVHDVFDAETGNPLKPNEIALTKEHLMLQKSEIESGLEALNELIADVEAL